MFWGELFSYKGVTYRTFPWNYLLGSQCLNWKASLIVNNNKSFDFL